MKLTDKDITALLDHARAKANEPQPPNACRVESDVDVALSEVKARLKTAIEQARVYEDAVTDVRAERDRLEISTDPDERPEAIHFTIVLAFLRKKLGELR
jgi:hypothetical protein